ncbi:TetR/AcrR family transcriptional regulator [Brevibacterium casei]
MSTTYGGTTAVSTPTTEKPRHHHGNLRAALVAAGIEMLEEGEPFSLRAVARRVGVSQAAPYRHFGSKQDIEAAMAEHGFRELQTALREVIDAAEAGRVPLVDLALTYIHFAEDHPALYALMFGSELADDEDRRAACAQVFALIEEVAAATHPDRDAHGMATAGWALAHGMATLHLEGTLGRNDDDFDARVRATFAAVAAD